ncbi:pilus assembly protein PilP [Acidithiobacillus sp. IBUN Pt1247-S3]|uniref:pilus assembly protein PilP n=1 Tax=Acidithiobacillus sp. IBUN Pt1247-S3 TaxID=3166642 RepID=UPI0034E5C4EE
MKTTSRIPILLAVTLMLSACSHNNNLANLQAFVEQGPQLHPKIEALPPIPHYTATAYTNAQHRDPFTSFSELALREEAAAEGAKSAPQRKGPLQPLEKYALGSLTLTGIMQADGQQWAVFLTPDNKVYRAGVGAGIGDKNGHIEAIDSQRHMVVITQYLPNAFGGYEQQSTTLHFQSNG